MNYHGKQLNIKRVLDLLGVRISQTTHSEHYAHCPFHTDSRPSFAINWHTGLWMCHKECGAGNITQLWNLITGDDMMTSVRRLLQLAAAFSEAELLALVNSMPGVEPIRKYKPMVLENYEPGVLPDYWLDRDFDAKFSAMWDIGYDPVLNAVVIPVCDPWGKVVGATRRLIEPTDEENKYHHDYSTPRNSILFGLHKIGTSKVMILVEGPTSCLRMHQHGFTATVAVMGASLSNIQMRLIQKRAHSVTLLFDNDKTGIEATDVIAQQLISKMSVFIARYPRLSGSYQIGDPADMTREQTKWALTHAQPYLFWVMKLFGVDPCR